MTADARVPAVVETPRLRLVRWDDRYRDDFVRLAADPVVVRYIGDGKPLDRDAATAIFERALRHWDERGFGWRCVLDPATGAWLGLVGTNRLGSGLAGVDYDEIEIGWWLDRSRWGSGLATEGARAVRDEAFHLLGVPRLVARVRPDNAASLRMAAKLGLRFDRETVGNHGLPVQILTLDRSAWEAGQRP
jgi:RimJ/RimL family protein N-acetyltransferase